MAKEQKSATKEKTNSKAVAKAPVEKNAKEVKKPAVKEEKAAPSTKTYHISLRKEDGKWQVKFASGQKALKLFDTQAEAIAFAKEKANNQDGNIAIHKVDGKIRKQKY